MPLAESSFSLYYMSYGQEGLLLLVPVLPQSLFPFVSSYLVSFSFFTARHNR